MNRRYFHILVALTNTAVIQVFLSYDCLIYINESLVRIDLNNLEGPAA